MKKILILLLLVVTINSNAEIITRNAEAIVIDENGKGFGKPILVDVDIVINTNLGQFVIYSKETQVFNTVVDLEDKYENGYHVVSYGVKDFYGGKAILKLYMSDTKKDLIAIEYSGMTYVYQLKEN